ncbi:MAG: polysaccharide biosynthesis protein [Alphaproteobacteria bacterium]|nr:polysaccharide biosynthesis protein [Alphaproteobacteria bacterium]
MAGITGRLIKRVSRTSVAYGHDVAMAALSFPLALYLRLGEDLAVQVSDEMLLGGTIAFAAIAAIVFRAMGLYRGIWRYASTNDLWAIVRAVSVAVIVFVATLFLATRLQGLPRSTPAINWLLLIFLLGGPRFVYRVFKDRHLGNLLDEGTPRVPVLLVGAGDQAEAFIRAVGRDGSAPYRIVGVVDTKDHRVGRRIHGMDVLGDVDAIPAVVQKLERRGKRPQRLIVTKTKIEPDKLRALLDVAERLGMTLGQLPRLTEFRATDAAAIGKLEPTPIPIEDLLGRPRRVLDREAMRALVAGRRVLVTGAGGTIGGELARQIAAFGPGTLALIDHSEYALYSIDLEIARAHPGLGRETVLADMRDRARVEQALAALRPELVFHAAALKHVPMVEANPEEGVLTNVVGTRNLADACRRHAVAAMVLISTDKAVDPTSVMGATKRLAECYCQALDRLERARAGGTRFVTVRFGNVLGSSGSVVPLFQRQIAEGGPLTVTHPEAVRYFMTVREAVELVIEASALGAAEPAEPAVDGSGRILVLDMGEPVRVVDLARQMVRLAGLTPDKDVKIVFTGLRPGEKLSEVLLHAAEELQPTRYPGILFAMPRATDHAVLARALDELADAASQRRGARTLDLLRRLVPEYRPDGDRVRLAAAAAR